MRKREREDLRIIEELKRTKRVKRNWIISIVSLLLAIFCYYFLDGIIAEF